MIRASHEAVILALVGAVVVAAVSPKAPPEPDSREVEREKRTTEIKDSFGFQRWPGKRGPVRDGFRVHAGLVRDGYRLRQRGPVRIHQEPGRGIVVRRSYRIEQSDGHGTLFLEIRMGEDCATAQESIVAFLVGWSLTCSVPDPLAGFALGTERGLELGDVCVAKHGVVVWARNNVFLYIRSQGNESVHRYLIPFASALDSAIVKRAVFPSYTECKSRPVITRVERTTPDERAELKYVDWKAVEVTKPEGEGVTLLPFRPRSGEPTAAGGVSVQMAVSDSNLVGFPLPGLAEWKQEGSNRAAVNAFFDEFFEKYAPRR